MEQKICGKIARVEDIDVLFNIIIRFNKHFLGKSPPSQHAPVVPLIVFSHSLIAHFLW